MFIVARDRALEKVLIGGLGCLGVGKMWFHDTGRFDDLDGYIDAGEEDYPGDCWDTITLKIAGRLWKKSS